MGGITGCSAVPSGWVLARAVVALPCWILSAGVSVTPLGWFRAIPSWSFTCLQMLSAHIRRIQLRSLAGLHSSGRSIWRPYMSCHSIGRFGLVLPFHWPDWLREWSPSCRYRNYPSGCGDAVRCECGANTGELADAAPTSRLRQYRGVALPARHGCLHIPGAVRLERSRTDSYELDGVVT